jgi:hypothetical protein
MRSFFEETKKLAMKKTSASVQGPENTGKPLGESAL